MPQIASYTPKWLSRPNPGHDIFTLGSPESQLCDSTRPNVSQSSTKRLDKPGPRRCIALRGSEVFVAVGKEIRWANLVNVKEVWDEHQFENCSSLREEKSETRSPNSGAQNSLYRTIKTPVADDIRQLLISPRGNHIAILTTHTIHIAILPEPPQLKYLDRSPIKLKCFTLGPTKHVTSQAGIITALWHPLGVNGNCIVTVTEDAVVRVWELSMGSHASFDQPTIGIDLKKLADGTSADQDFRASDSGFSGKTFSPDSFEMQVASACFSGKGSGGWSPMTLWIAMRTGDVYALCPLLPEKWSPTPNLMSSLSVSIVARVAAIEDDPTVSQVEKDLAQQQLIWMSEIDNQEPYIIEIPGEPSVEVFCRPLRPGKIPRLQGPLQIELALDESDDELVDLLSDIYVIGGVVNSQELSYDEYEDPHPNNSDQEGPSIDIVCLLSSSGRVSVCLALDSIEAHWLPKSKSKAWKLSEEVEFPSLLTFEVMDLLRDSEIWEGNWPLFSGDICSRYSFYITSTSTINFIDLTPWVFRLGAELDGSSAGSDFRIDILAKSKESTLERLFTKEALCMSSHFSASVLCQDTDLGHFLLTASSDGPVVLKFEGSEPESEFYRSMSRSPTFESEEPEKIPVICEPRPVYEPSHFLNEDSKLPEFLERMRHSRFKRLLKTDVRLSPAILSTMTEAHKVLSDETYRIGTGAAELFRKCERLQIDLIGHIKKANEVAMRVKSVTGIDPNDKSKKSRKAILEERLQSANQRNKNLTYRLERLRKNALNGTSLPLSEKEKSWAEELQTLETKLIGPKDSSEKVIKRLPWERYAKLSSLSKDLLEQVTHVSDTPEPASPNYRVSADIKKQKFKMVQEAIDREEALVEAVKERLEKLTTSL
ncbi:Nucleoporin NUP82 [Golovinomyces cichoracearum]|uniref:Nucleoporin NUP82 n=1 Tax=Golovinomyces cichoracearum TaxID=62708 RepID=A0A420HWE3_9PEZI|nr:Nucleoporin NUP82 [Golovinomyces cichoracearum]